MRSITHYPNCFLSSLLKGMVMYPAFVLNMLRARINENLVDTCTIERYQDVSDAYGAPVRTLVSSTSSACYLIRKQASSNGMVTGADQSMVNYELQLPYDADIEDGDSVVLDGERYETVQVYRNQSQNVMRQAELVKAGA